MFFLSRLFLELAYVNQNFSLQSRLPSPTESTLQFFIAIAQTQHRRDFHYDALMIVFHRVLSFSHGLFPAIRCFCAATVDGMGKDNPLLAQAANRNVREAFAA
jgi:hypothetical protein